MACSGPGEPPQVATDEPAAPSASPPASNPPGLRSAKGLSTHYVEVEFVENPGSGADQAERYHIKGADGKPLTVRAAIPTDDERRVVLQTDPHDATNYTLQYDAEEAGGTAAVTSSAGADRLTEVSYTGTPAVEPQLLSAIALSNTSILLNFDVKMDTISTASILRYRIESPGLNITAASLAADAQSLTVTTSPQDDLLYTVKVGGVKSQTSVFLDPAFSSPTFYGIARNDVTSPRLVQAEAMSYTTVRLSYSEPVENFATVPSSYSISTVSTPTTTVVVLGASLNFYGTQVTLITLPLTRDVAYTVRVSNVEDRAGRAIDSSANSATFTFRGGLTEPPDEREAPRVVGAIATSNTSVDVHFSEPMGESAAEDEHYRIMGPNGAFLFVEEAELSNDRTTAHLETSSQTDLLYTVQAAGVKDLAGNPIAAPSSSLSAIVGVDPTKATFLGIPPAGPEEQLDSDNDGFADSNELSGWRIVIQLTNGDQIIRFVTSDPNNRDTDGDGFTDGQERAYNLDPRSKDTDGDGLDDVAESDLWYSDPTDQDSDDDLIDDSSEVTFFRTSPIFADTDGDGMDDPDEISRGNRNARIANLPDPGIEIGQVALRLDTRFEFTDSEGESKSVEKATSATLSRSQSRTLSTSDQSTTESAINNSNEFGIEHEFGANASTSASFTAEVGYSYTRGNTFSVDQESSEEMQEEYQESLTTSATRDVSREITRTVEGASIEALVTINNAGQIPFTVKNLQLTGLLQDPFDRKSFLPVATLLPASVLEGGGDLSVTLGPFIRERGPFVFKNQEVFPSLIEDLMKNPRGILFTVANFDIQDEEGRNFAFISEDVNDLTAGLIIDYGNGGVDRFRVATYGGLDSKRVLGGSCSNNSSITCQDDDDCEESATCVSGHVGGFSGSGRPSGVPMAFALQDILGLAKNEAPNAITVGSNGCGETWAVGDDIQVAAPLCFSVQIGGVIIQPGPNGTLDSMPMGDDVKSGNTIIDGGDGCAHTRASRDDVQVIQGGCQDAFPDGVMVLPGPNGTIDTTLDGDDRQMTVTGYGTELVGACDGNTTRQITAGPNGMLNTTRTGDDTLVSGVIRAGVNGILETSPNLDDVLEGPGMPCADNDDCPGPGSCHTIERLTRVKGVENVQAEKRFWVILTNVTIPPGTNFDEVVLQAGQVFSLAYVQDRDDDGLIAQEEFLYGSSDRDDNSDGCPFGDGAVGCDAVTFDFDTVRDFDEVKKGWTVAISGGRRYSAYPNPIQPDSDADGLFDDEELFLSTDPGKRDTDSDEISDAREVRGYDVVRRDGVLIRHVPAYQSAFIGAGPNNTLDTTAVGDDQRTRHAAARDIITPGPNGMIDSVPDNDDVLEASTLILDGGNGIPESAASGDDVQIGPAPSSTASVTVTLLDYSANGDACDGSDAGEFNFNLRIRKNVETVVGNLVQQSVPIEPLTPYDFDGAIYAGPNGRADTARTGDDVQVTSVGAAATNGVVIRPGANGILDTTTLGGDDVIVNFGTGNNVFTFPLEPSDMLTISGTVREVEPQCNSQTRKAVIEPGQVIIEPVTGGNGRANSTAAGDDIQEVSLNATVTAGRVIISPGPNGVLESVPSGDDVRPMGNGFADTLATGDDEQVIPLADPASPGDFIVLCGANGEPDMSLAPATPGICQAAIVRTVLGDGTADTAATGDDVQLIEVGDPVQVGQAVVGPGSNQVIDTNPTGSNEALEDARAPLACAPAITHASSAGNGIAETSASGDDVQLIQVGAAASADAVIIGPGPNNVINSNVARNVVRRTLAGLVTTLAEGDDIQIRPVGTNVAANTVVVGPGRNGNIDSDVGAGETIENADDQLIAAHTLNGLSCTTCPLGSCVNNCSLCPTGSCTGDDVLLVRSAGSACDDGICPCGQCIDGPFVEWVPQRSFSLAQLKSLADANGIINVAFTGIGAPACFQRAELGLRIQISAGVTVTPGAVIVRAGGNGVLNTIPGGDDIIGAPHLTVYATDPLDRDTDGDTLLDGAEVFLGANPNDAADAASFRDNDLDGLANIEEIRGWFIGVADENGLRCRRADGSFIDVEDEFNPPAGCVVVHSDPFEPDTDFDGLPDLLEMIIRSDPTSVDTDDDVLLDLDEFDPASGFSIELRDFREFQRRCGDAGRCRFTQVEGPYGTSVVLADTDDDGRDDRSELFEGWVILPCVGSTQLPFEVFSSPLSQDADRDGVLDGEELDGGTDPADPDTDTDGIADGVDPVPTGCGKVVTVSFDSYRTMNDCDGSGENGEWNFEFWIYRGNQSVQDLLGQFRQLNGDLDDNRTHEFSDNSATFTMRPGEQFRIVAKLWEDDASGGDEIWNLNRVITFDQVPNSPVQYGPLPGEYNDGCFNGHQLTVNITYTGA